MTRFDAFVAPARPRAAIWQTSIGFLAIIAMTLAGSLLFTTLVMHRFAAEVAQSWAILASFGVPFLAICFVTATFHHRSPATLFGTGALRDGLRVLAYVGVGIGGLALIPGGGPLMAGLPFELWLRWLVPSLVVLLVQVSAEEMLFRGYLLQQLGARFPSPWVWMVGPSVVFGLLHYDTETYGSFAPWIVGVTMLLAVAMADLTARAGNLGPAIAVHFANNIMAILIISVDDPMMRLSLYVQPLPLDRMGWEIAAQTVQILIVWLLARLAIKR